jgi:hypothetical protein
MSSGKMERHSVTGLVTDGRLTGAFHLTEIPEILLENQMEHVYFWNDVSLISKSLTLPLKSPASIRRNKSRLEALKWSRTRHFGFGGGFCSKNFWKAATLVGKCFNGM